MSIRASVVVPTYQRPDLLRRCLAALLAQDFDPAAYEIIVVDDAASEETRRVVDTCAEDPSRCIGIEAPPLASPAPPADSLYSLPSQSAEFLLHGLSPHENPPLAAGAPSEEAASGYGLPGSSSETLMSEPRPAALPAVTRPLVRYIPLAHHQGPAAARNVGWRAAAGEIIAFTDDDCIPSPAWLREGVAAFQRRVVGVSGRIIMPVPRQPTDYELNASYLTHSEFVTANCFYLRSMLAAVGGFDERFTAAWREDSDLFFTMLKDARTHHYRARFVCASGALVFHPLRRGPWGVSLQQQRKNMFNALLYKKHPDLYRERLGSVTPWHYYLILAALLWTLVAAIAGQWVLALVGLLAWGALTARFCAGRLVRTSHDPAHLAEMVVTSILIPPLALYWRARGALRYKVWFL